MVMHLIGLTIQKKKYAVDQEYAKKNKLGLWSMKFEFPWDFKKKNK